MKTGLFQFLLKFLPLILCLISIDDIQAQKKSKIKFEADNIEYDESLGKKARRLIDNVVFEHNGVFMYCDSAYHYLDKNSLDAFGRVHIKQGDSLNLYSDSLYYDGEKEIFTCKSNVVLDNRAFPRQFLIDSFDSWHPRCACCVTDPQS